MAEKVLKLKTCSPVKLHGDLLGNYYAICRYSYNLPLANMQEKRNTLCNKKMRINIQRNNNFDIFEENIKEIKI